MRVCFVCCLSHCSRSHPFDHNPNLPHLTTASNYHNNFYQPSSANPKPLSLSPASKRFPFLFPVPSERYRRLRCCSVDSPSQPLSGPTPKSGTPARTLELDFSRIVKLKLNANSPATTTRGHTIGEGCDADGAIDPWSRTTPSMIERSNVDAVVGLATMNSP
jgi:hypothetical protein